MDFNGRILAVIQASTLPSTLQNRALATETTVLQMEETNISTCRKASTHA